MSTYEVTWVAEGTVVLEADTNHEAVQEALDRVIDLEEHDASVTVNRTSQVHVQTVADFNVHWQEQVDALRSNQVVE